jgi:hypothetical protein
MIICHCSRGRIHMQTSLHQHRLSVQLCKRLQVGRDTPPRMILPLPPQVVREEPLKLKYPRISIGVPILIVNSKDFKGEEKVETQPKPHRTDRSNIIEANAFTFSNKGVFMAAGATQLALIWSRDHSHAKLLVSWFNAPAYI